MVNKTDLGGNTTYGLILLNKVLSFFLGFCLFAFNIRQTTYIFQYNIFLANINIRKVYIHVP